jgi:hypothetical protein
MNSKAQSAKVWIGGGAAGLVVVALLGWFAVISPQLSSTSAIKDQTASVEMQNVVLEGKVSKLRNQNDQLKSLTTTLDRAQQELPSDSGLPDYTRQLIQQANTTGVTLGGISAGAPTAVLSSGATASSGAVNGPAGHLFSIPINLVSSGTLPQNRAFLKAIQSVGPRRALVTAAQFAPGTTGSATPAAVGQVNMTLQLLVYVAPQTPADEAALQRQLAKANG